MMLRKLILPLCVSFLVLNAFATFAIFFTTSGFFLFFFLLNLAHFMHAIHSRQGFHINSTVLHDLLRFLIGQNIFKVKEDCKWLSKGRMYVKGHWICVFNVR